MIVYGTANVTIFKDDDIKDLDYVIDEGSFEEDE